jgi:hypothetical protein
VPVPINGSTQHTGKLPDDSYLVESAVNAGTCQAALEYRSTYKADSANYRPPGRTGGGFWFEERQRKAAGTSAGRKDLRQCRITYGTWQKQFA